MRLLLTEGAANNAFKFAPHSVTNKQTSWSWGWLAPRRPSELELGFTVWTCIAPACVLITPTPTGMFFKFKDWARSFFFQLNVKYCPAAVGAMTLISNQVCKKKKTWILKFAVADGCDTET